MSKIKDHLMIEALERTKKRVKSKPVTMVLRLQDLRTGDCRETIFTYGQCQDISYFDDGVEIARAVVHYI